MPYSPASQKEHCLRCVLVSVILAGDYGQVGTKETAFYITERSATTHIAMHPELRLVV